MDELIQCVKYWINELTYNAMNEKMDLYIIIFFKKRKKKTINL